MSQNFGFLEHHDRLLLQLAATAEQAFVPDPNTTPLRLRQLGESIAQDIARLLGIEVEDRVLRALTPFLLAALTCYVPSTNIGYLLVLLEVPHGQEH